MHTNKTEDIREVSLTEAQIPNNFLYRLKTKWGLENLFQVIIVLLVFALTGSTVVFLRKTLFDFIGFDETTSIWLKTIIYIGFVFPAYQCLLLIYGSLFGQFNFFWNKEKKLFYFVRKLFTKKNKMA